jgi:hypothetical protein
MQGTIPKIEKSKIYLFLTDIKTTSMLLDRRVGL